jgi:hypothetical protein
LKQINIFPPEMQKEKKRKKRGIRKSKKNLKTGTQETDFHMRAEWLLNQSESSLKAFAEMKNGAKKTGRVS